jgi:ankyrin repeat protein
MLKNSILRKVRMKMNRFVFFKACRDGKYDVVKRGIEGGFDLTSVLHDDIPLAWAVSGGQYEIVKLLLTHYPNFSQLDRKGRRSVESTIIKSTYCMTEFASDYMEQIVNAGVNLNERKGNFSIILDMFVKKIDPKYIVKLIELGADPDDIYATLPLQHGHLLENEYTLGSAYMASFYEQFEPYVTRMTKDNVRKYYSIRLLHAVKNDRVDDIPYLLSHGANLNDILDYFVSENPELKVANIISDLELRVTELAPDATRHFKSFRLRALLT